MQHGYYNSGLLYKNKIRQRRSLLSSNEYLFSSSFDRSLLGLFLSNDNIITEMISILRVGSRLLYFYDQEIGNAHGTQPCL